MKTNKTWMLAILILNDLLASSVVDQTIYDMAVDKIKNNDTLVAGHTEMPATA